jgi:hypothetical protein
MHHDAFGQLIYDQAAQLWRGRIPLPHLATYGAGQTHPLLPPADELFRTGSFPLTIQDEQGYGPSAQQAAALTFLHDNEEAVCRALAVALLKSSRAHRHWSDRLKKYRNSRVWGWAARWLIGEEYQSAEELRADVRCAGVEISALYVGVYAYVGFRFAAPWEYENGLSVVYHPDKGAIWGDARALHCVEEVETIDE